jgi:hypothetical protein
MKTSYSSITLNIRAFFQSLFDRAHVHIVWVIILVSSFFFLFVGICIAGYLYYSFVYSDVQGDPTTREKTSFIPVNELQQLDDAFAKIDAEFESILKEE